MKSIFDESTTDELIRRISMLNENSKAQWGKMDVYQMIKHCTLWEEMITGKMKTKRMFLGRLFGKMALKNMIKDEKPVKRNMPTVPGFNIKDHGEVLSEKNKWITMVKEHAHFSNTGFIHPFFGKMTKEQIGLLAYKHTDHHLRQFNC
ncbi:MAG TPA: DUF1569 domain-containing protein [Puia sp.]|nr:DUF1569 domain-containing protein [Puia sp.]